jgi:CRP-like cAMP-binding protein
MKRSSDLLIRKLEARTRLGPDDIEAIRSLPFLVKDIASHTPITTEGVRPQQSTLIIEGFVCRSKMTDVGKRQIMSIHIAGDIPDLQSMLLHVMDHDLTTLSRCTIASIPHDALRDMTRRHPLVAEALWRETLRDGAVFREWIVNVGRRPAEARMAHFIAEIGRRLEGVGLATADRYELPMTQVEMADALGLSAVHVNRVLQSLRRTGVIELRNQAVSVRDLRQLEQIADFNDLYLHQDALL